ncbi:MAG: hypothetical protein IKP00_08820 [Victivallales bacterium]|nr:hypothetical protein [Victivallales bacterium]
MTLSLTGRWPGCAVPLRCATRQGARGLGWASDRGFRFVAIAASLHPRLCSCRRCRGFAPTRLRFCHGYVPAAVVAALLCW